MMRVKGIAFLGLVSFVSERFEQPVLVDVFEGLVDHPEIFLRSLEPFGWYPWELFGQAFEVVMKELGSGDPLFAREIGAHIFGLYHRTYPEDLIRAPGSSLVATINRLWLIYHDQGSVAVIEEGEDFVLKLMCPVQLTRSYLEGVAGWIESLLALWKMEGYGIFTTDDPTEIRIIKMASGSSVSDLSACS
ncbi:MAG: hypothetical protein ABIM74_09410 [candidate division WOR-3 bacterium]